MKNKIISRINRSQLHMSPQDRAMSKMAASFSSCGKTRWKAELLLSLITMSSKQSFFWAAPLLQLCWACTPSWVELCDWHLNPRLLWPCLLQMRQWGSARCSLPPMLPTPVLPSFVLFRMHCRDTAPEGTRKFSSIISNRAKKLITDKMQKTLQLVW